MKLKTLSFNQFVKTKKYKCNAIICCAMKIEDGTVITGYKHKDQYMQFRINQLFKMWSVYDIYGFVDMHGNFVDREEALIIVKENKQKFDADMNKHETELYFEGIYPYIPSENLNG